MYIYIYIYMYVYIHICIYVYNIAIYLYTHEQPADSQLLMLKFLRGLCSRRRHSEEPVVEPEAEISEEESSPAESSPRVLALPLPGDQPEPEESPALRILVERVPVHIYQVTLGSGTVIQATHQLPSWSLNTDTHHRDLRIYTVWEIPGWAHRYRGVHWGLGTAAYQAILELNNKEFRGIRWRRADTFTLAIERFTSEAHEFDPAEDLLEVFGWRVVDWEQDS